MSAWLVRMNIRLHRWNDALELARSFEIVDEILCMIFRASGRPVASVLEACQAIIASVRVKAK